MPSAALKKLPSRSVSPYVKNVVHARPALHVVTAKAIPQALSDMAECEDFEAFMTHYGMWSDFA